MGTVVCGRGGVGSIAGLVEVWICLVGLATVPLVQHRTLYWNQRSDISALGGHVCDILQERHNEHRNAGGCNDLTSFPP